MNTTPQQTQVTVEDLVKFASRKCTTCWGGGLVAPARTDSDQEVKKTAPCPCTIRRYRHLAKVPPAPLEVAASPFSLDGIAPSKDEETPVLNQETKTLEDALKASPSKQPSPSKLRQIENLQRKRDEAEATFNASLHKYDGVVRLAGVDVQEAKESLDSLSADIEEREDLAAETAIFVAQAEQQLALLRKKLVEADASLAEAKSKKPALQAALAKAQEAYRAAVASVSPLIEKTYKELEKYEYRLQQAKARL